jgi:Flp pilus assembly protein TadD
MSQLVNRPTGALIADPEQPLITAVLITRNKESYLRECLCGLMEQSIANRMEVIAVDLGSEQSEWSMLVELQRRYRNLTVLRTSSDLGICAGVNLASKIARGSYITVIEATDRLRDTAYEMLAGALDTMPEAMVAYGDTCFTAIPHETFADHTSYGKMVWPEYTYQQLSQLPLIAPHLMWRREMADSIGPFDERFQSEGMREFLMRVVQRHKMVHLVDFVGLKLVASGTALNQEVSERELAVLKQTYQGAAAQTAAIAPFPAAAPQQQPVAPAPACQAAAPQPAAPVTKSCAEAYEPIQALINSEAHLQAAAALAQHLETYPGHALAHNDLGSIACLLGEHDTALSHFRRAVQLSPAETSYRKNLADQLFVHAGQADEAIGIYLELHQAAPRDTETLLSLAIICEQVGQPAEAETFYQRIVEIEPWKHEVRKRLSELRTPKSEPVALHAVKADAVEMDAKARYQASQSLVARGDLTGAERELQGILASQPDFPLAHNDLAVLYYQDGAKEQALFHYERAAALAPGNSIFRKNLADFYFVEGHDVDGAVAIYLDLLEQEPRNIETLMSLGKICTLLDRPEEAKSFYGKVAQLEPWNRDARECLTTLRQVVNG